MLFRSDAVAIGDLNGDGLADLAVANRGANSLSVLLGTGGGGFQSHDDYSASGDFPGAVVATDLDADGLPDLATVHSDHVSVLLNDTPAPVLPDAPTAVSAVPADGEASVFWTASASDGGSPISAYVVTPYVGYSPRPSTTFSGFASSGTVTGLTNGTTYRFKVAAISGIGQGPQSTISNAARPGRPDAPTAVTAVGGTGKARVSWTAPTTAAASGVTGYVVTPYIGGVAQTPVSFDSKSTVEGVTDLTNGTTYTFTVAAFNSAGIGPESAMSNAVELGLPGAPTAVTALAGVGKVRLSWTAPAMRGASPVTSYVVTPYIGAIPQTPITFPSKSTVEGITGLANGTTYTFTVAAINGIGTGPQSAPSNPATPTAH